MSEWSPGGIDIIMNWPTLSQDESNPDAGFWDPANWSHCSNRIKDEGWKRDKVRAAV